MKEGKKKFDWTNQKPKRSENETLNNIGFVPTLQFQNFMYLDI